MVAELLESLLVTMRIVQSRRAVEMKGPGEKRAGPSTAAQDGISRARHRPGMAKGNCPGNFGALSFAPLACVFLYPPPSSR